MSLLSIIFIVFSMMLFAVGSDLLKLRRLRRQFAPGSAASGCGLKMGSPSKLERLKEWFHSVGVSRLLVPALACIAVLATVACLEVQQREHWARQKLPWIRLFENREIIKFPSIPLLPDSPLLEQIHHSLEGEQVGISTELLSRHFAVDGEGNVQQEDFTFAPHGTLQGTTKLPKPPSSEYLKKPEELYAPPK